jgi:hypothetical protein
MTAFTCRQHARKTGSDGDVPLTTRAGREVGGMYRCCPVDWQMIPHKPTGSAMANLVSGCPKAGVWLADDKKGGDARTSRHLRQIIRTAIAVPSTGTDQRCRDYQATLSPTD